VQIPITLIASLIGLWLFYIQHQFERTYWEPGRTWTFAESALHGSSHYRLPAILRWFTANIGLHHIHHFCSQIPNYHLAECLADNPALEARTQLTFWQSLRCGRLALWDEDRKRLVAFNEIS
jgi:omega-6 fatty acid desaturase (delta-12 desaturase)